jgi:hypothetical protein
MSDISMDVRAVEVKKLGVRRRNKKEIRKLIWMPFEIKLFTQNKGNVSYFLFILVIK